MPYLHINDFKIGADRRRPRTVGVPGSLYTLKNALISKGGDIVRAKKLVPAHTLPPNTFGLYALRGQLWTFGSFGQPDDLPVAFQYQRLSAPDTPSMIAVLDVKAFDGKLYVVAEYDNGSVYHFYDGARVTTWDSITATTSARDVARRLGAKIDALPSVSALVAGATILITARTPGTSFSLSVTALDDGADATQSLTIVGLQGNVAAVAEVRATATLEVTGGFAGNQLTALTVDATNLIDAPVSWATSNEATALAIANAIGNLSTTHNYSVTVSGAVVTISAPVGQGATTNGLALAPTITGSFSIATTNFAGGVDAVEAVARVASVTVGGVVELSDTFAVTIDGTTVRSTGRAAVTGTMAFVHKRRVWSLVGSLLRYCKLNTPSDWSTVAVPATDAGFINVSSESEGAQDLVGLGVYQGNLAIFARDTIIVYAISTDATDNAYVETVENTGALAPRSILSFGNTDLFYLDATGVRSVRARQGTNAAYKSDIGEAIDSFVQEMIDEVGEQAAERAQAIIDPRDGRYLLAIGRYILAYSYYPDSKIFAWSHLDFETVIGDMVRSRRDIYVRAGDTIYRYGGATGAVYPDAGEFPVVAETPFMDAKDPAAKKMLDGFDLFCEGSWKVEVLVDPNNFAAIVEAGIFNRNSYTLPDAKLPGQTTHVAFRFTCATAGYASLSSMAIHYEKGKAA